MSSDILLYPAILIFSLLVIGLVFTVIEFSKLQKKSDKDRQKED
jgi:hypothetical protein